MRKKRLFWQLFAAYTLVTMLVLSLVYLFSVRAIRSSSLTFYEEQLESRALLVREYVRALPDSAIDAACKSLGHASRTRITVVDARGRVIGDSHGEPSRMPNHANRREIARAFEGELGMAIRVSDTIGRSMMYVAVPLVEQGEVRAVVRVAVPFESIEDSVRTLSRNLAGVAVATLLLLSLLSLGVAQRIKEPLQRLTNAARAFAEGSMDQAMPPTDLTEIDELAQTLRHMAARLNERISDITRDRNEREAMLSSMVEGVLAVDSSERVVRMNEACGWMLGVSPAKAEGRTIQEAVRNSQLESFIRRALSASDSIEADIAVWGDEERHLRAHGALLHDRLGERVGVVVVLHDVTKIRRLERVRKDFVANVSHELKTPIAAIRGAAETLRAGALSSEADAARFVEIIERQASRLDAVIGDLLMLSRIEEEEAQEIPLEERPLEPTIRAAVQTVSGKAAQKGVTVQVVCPSGISARMAPPLLETAVVNLLDNAIAYSEAGTTVTVDVRRNGEIIISVEDQGCGIEAKHLDRIFERFYRVDRARSRTLGGTGLGLAIVKHIAQVHRGRVTVDSTPGVGSTFRIHLPLP